jgi:PAS domain-containing protein
MTPFANLKWLEKSKELSPHTQVVMIAAHAEVDLAVEAIERGAMDFIGKPWRNEKLLATLKSALLCIDEQDRIVLWNQGARKLFHRSYLPGLAALEQVDPALLDIVNTIQPGDRRSVGLPIQQENVRVAVRMRRIQTWEHRCRGRNGDGSGVGDVRG